MNEIDKQNESDALDKYCGEYTKKRVTVTAVLFDGSNESVTALNSEKFGLDPVKVIHEDGKDFVVIDTLEGSIRANVGDYIIRGVNGEFYPCKPDVFAKTYEKEDVEK